MKGIRLFVILSFLASISCFAAGGKGVKIFNVTDYGAVPDGKTICTDAINKAVTDCNKNGSGQVYFPPGEYLSGTIVLKDNIELYFERGSVLLASTRHEDFPLMVQPPNLSDKSCGGWYALIYAENANCISLRGFGTIDGQGKEQKPDPELLDGGCDSRPCSILLISCKNVRIEGITMLNSGSWNQHYLNCEDVIIDKIEVFNHSNRNNDAIDIDGCRRFILSNSILDSDDDGITLKSLGTMPCEDIVITNCIVSSHCNAIKAGTESTGGFKNISISNCIIKPSRSEIKPIFHDFPSGITGISLEIVDGGTMEGITISNITIEGTKCPLYIRLGNRGRQHFSYSPEISVGVMKNISISNLVAYNAGNFSNSITAIPGYYIENVTLSNIQFFNEGGVRQGEYIETMEEVAEDETGYPQPTVWMNLPSSALFVRHVRNLMIQGLLIGSNEEDPRSPIIANDVKGLSIRNTRVAKHNTASTFFLGKDIANYEVEKPLGWNREITSIK